MIQLEPDAMVVEMQAENKRLRMALGKAINDLNKVQRGKVHPKLNDILKDIDNALSK